MRSGHSRFRTRRNSNAKNLHATYSRSNAMMKPRLLCCLLILTLLVACSKKSAPPAASGIPAARSFHDLRELPGTIADITLTNTVHIDEITARRILKSVGSDGNIFVLDDSDPRIQNLQEGQILFLENIAVQKVLAVAKKDK